MVILKSLVLAAGCFAFIVLTSAVLSRLYKGKQEYKVLLGTFAMSVVVYVVLYEALPPNLYALPAGWLEPAHQVDFWNGLLVLALVFHGFWTFCYVCWTGPSIGLMNAIRKCEPEGLTSAEALAIYGENEPVNLLLVRRLPKLMNGDYIEQAAAGYRLLPKGRHYARLGFALRRIINLLPERESGDA